MAPPPAKPRRRRVLVANDDGIDAPGLTALVRALAEADATKTTTPPIEVFVCAPDGERSAQSHAITLNREMSAVLRVVEGARAAYAVRGTPADAVMLALNSALFDEDHDDGDDEDKHGGGRGAGKHATSAPPTKKAFYPGEANADAIGALSPGAAAAPGCRFDLVVSGINRGDNAGMHVIYSGTVGAAREGACKGVPSVALSLDDHGARSERAFEAAARASAALVAAVLSVLRDGEEAGGGGGEAGSRNGEPARWRAQQGAAAARGGAATATTATTAAGAAAAASEAAWALRQGLVLNVNLPREGAGAGGGGLALCHQGTGCIYPAYKEVAAEEEEGGGAAGRGGGGGRAAAAVAAGKQWQQRGAAPRVFRAFAGGARHDDADWCDTWAVRLGWTSVTPLSLRQDLRLPPALVPPAVGGGDGLGGDGPAPSSRDADAQEALAEAGMAAASEVVRRAAAVLGVPAGGHLLPPLV